MSSRVLELKELLKVRSAELQDLLSELSLLVGAEAITLELMAPSDRSETGLILSWRAGQTCLRSSAELILLV